MPGRRRPRRKNSERPHRGSRPGPRSLRSGLLEQPPRPGRRARAAGPCRGQPEPPGLVTMSVVVPTRSQVPTGLRLRRGPRQAQPPRTETQRRPGVSPGPGARLGAGFRGDPALRRPGAAAVAAAARRGCQRRGASLNHRDWHPSRTASDGPGCPSPPPGSKFESLARTGPTAGGPGTGRLAGPGTACSAVH